MRPHLELIDVSKRYGATAAVQGVSLSVAEGEFISLLGPSGSGKTTTLMMIAGFETVSGGHIRLGGTTVEDLPPHERNIGMMFQNYALFPHMTVAQNIGFPLKVRRRPKPEIKAAVERYLEMVGLSAHADKRPAQLSGGQQQRVALARALVFEPRLLLLDEPLSALDKNLREQMQQELRRIHRQVGVTTLYVTHDQGEAMMLSDRIAVFNQGRIEQIGRPDEIYERPATRFTASFIGDSNIIAGTRGETADILLTADGSALRCGSPLPEAQASLLVRPEKLQVGEAPEGANSLSLTIGGVVNIGVAAMVTGRAAGQEIRLRAPVSLLPSLREGETLPVWWHAADGWPLPAPQE
jgi:putative spermidine/putrescine transport system ATP-binding protein